MPDSKANDKERKSVYSLRNGIEMFRKKQEQTKNDRVNLLRRKYSLNLTEAKELYLLLQDMQVKGFRTSLDLSNHITSNNLGPKYPTISGYVRMRDGGGEWTLEGGFDRLIYRIICQELGLSDQGTDARAVGFTSYRDMQEY